MASALAFWILPSNSVMASSWSTIFYICGVCQLLAGLFFGAFAEVERAKVEDKKD